MGSTVFRFGRNMRDVKLQSILSCSKGRSWHLGGFSGHSFSKELRLISSFHHLGNDMAIKAYTIKCQNYHKKRSDMPNEILMLIYVSVRLVEASILSFWKFEHFYVTVELWNI